MSVTHLRTALLLAFVVLTAAAQWIAECSYLCHYGKTGRALRNGILDEFEILGRSFCDESKLKHGLSKVQWRYAVPKDIESID